MEHEGGGQQRERRSEKNRGRKEKREDISFAQR